MKRFFSVNLNECNSLECLVLIHGSKLENITRAFQLCLFDGILHIFSKYSSTIHVDSTIYPLIISKVNFFLVLVIYAKTQFYSLSLEYF